MKTGLLTVGLTTLDIVAKAVDALTHTERAILIEGVVCVPAGTAGGAAMVAARLGLPVGIIGAVGDDLTGDFVRLGLERTGVDTRLLAVRAGQRTSTTLLTVETDGRRSSYHALGAGIGASIDAAGMAAAGEARFVHYGGIGGLATDGGPGEALLRAAKASGAIVTCDLISPRPSALEELGRLLPHVDYFMPSADEALGLTGAGALEAAAERFVAMGAGACIIKNGSKGSHCLLDGRHHVLPAFPITPVDTTSCGDSFCAGFIAALARDWPVLEACRFATMTAALVAQGLGTLGKLESFAATAAALEAATRP